MDQAREVRPAEETRSDASSGLTNWGMKLPQTGRDKLWAGAGLWEEPRSLGLDVFAVSFLLDTRLDTEAWSSERGLGWKGGPGEAGAWLVCTGENRGRRADKNREKYRARRPSDSRRSG